MKYFCLTTCKEVMCKWFKDFFKIKIPELDYHIQFFTKYGGWTTFIFDDGSYYYGEIAEPESFEGYNAYYIRWTSDAPPNKKLVEEFIYIEYKKE